MSILKVNTIQDKGGNAIISSDGSGNLTQSFASNTPSFWVALSSNQSISHDTSTKIQFNTVTLDTNSDWDSSNYRFTPSVAGYYFIYAKWRMSSAANSNQLKTELKKNGTEFSTSSQVSRGGSNTSDASGIVYLNGSTDYIEAYGYHVTSVSETIAGQTQYTLFQGFKIIGA